MKVEISSQNGQPKTPDRAKVALLPLFIVESSLQQLSNDLHISDVPL